MLFAACRVSLTMRNARALVSVGLIAVSLEHVPDFVAPRLHSLKLLVKLGYYPIPIFLDGSKLPGHQVRTLANKI
jgi:hypothetical protein